MVVPAAWALRRWNAPGAKPFFALGLLAAAWALIELGAQLATSPDTQLFFDKLSYISAYVPLFALFLALDYRSELGGLSRTRLAALLAIPTLTLLFAITNEYHHLIWTSWATNRLGDIRLLHVNYGPWFWVFEIYATASSLGGAVLLARTLWGSTKVQSSQAVLIASGFAITWIANTAYNLKVGPWPGLDLTPVGCALSAILCSFSLFRYQLFEIAPVAYEALIRDLNDCLVVLDENRRILFFNESAADALRLTANRIGTVFIPPYRTPEGLPEQDFTALDACLDVTCEIDYGTSTRYFELSIAQHTRRKWDGTKTFAGRVIQLHDVTSKQAQKLALELSQDELARSSEIVTGLSHELESAAARSRRLAGEAEQARSMVERILTATPNVVYIYDIKQNRAVYVNQVVESALGFKPDRITANRAWLRAGVHPEDREAVISNLEACLKIRDGEILEFEYRARHSNGQWRWMMSRHCVFTRDDAGNVTQVLGTAADVTGRRHQETTIREQEERWQLALHGNSEGLWDWDIVRGLIYRSAGWKRMFGYEGADGAEPVTEWRKLIHPEDIARVEETIAEHLEGKTLQYVCEYRIRSRSGVWRWVLDRARCIRNDQGHAVRMAGSQSDITERKALEQRLANEALVDPLTGLPNRRHLFNQLDEAFARARRDGAALSVALGDIDSFKHINDSFGHAAGDRVLNTLADLLRPCLRAGDFAGRLGGDEFCVFFPGSTAAMAATALERIRTQLNAMVFTSPDMTPFHASISFGVAELRHETDSSDLVDAADRNLYLAKHRGRNCTVGAGEVAATDQSSAVS